MSLQVFDNPLHRIFILCLRFLFIILFYLSAFPPSSLFLFPNNSCIPLPYPLALEGYFPCWLFLIFYF